MNLPPALHRPSALAWVAAVLCLLGVAGCASRHLVATAKPAAPEAPAPAASVASGYPFAAARTRTRDYFGVTVSDDFAWLDDAHDPATRAWIAAENAYARRHLDAMPVRAALRQRLQSLAGSTANVYSSLAERGGVVFALKAASPQRRPVLVALKSLDDAGSERVVFDPAKAAPDGALAIAFFRPSSDGRKVALGLSSGDGVTLRILDVASGRLLADEIPHAVSPDAVGDAAWSAGDAGLFCFRTSAAGTPQVVFHAIGSPASQDRVELSDGLPPRARIRLESTRDGRHVLALVEDVRGGEASLFLKSADAGGWRRLASGSDGVRDALFGDDDTIWVLSVANAPRGKLLRLPLAATKTIAWDKLAGVAVPQQGAVQRFAVSGGTLYVVEGEGGVARLRTIDLRSRRSSVVALPATSGVAALARTGRGEVVAQVVSELEPPLWLRVSAGRARRTSLVASSDASFGDSEVVRELATSRDGTPVPLSILRRKGTRLDGHNPVLLTIAGATPEFDPARRVWLDRGGVVARATLRAGSQDGLDDFIAAAERLFALGYTQASLLGVDTRGDGALAAAAAMARRPALFRALVGVDGRFDLLRAGRAPDSEDDVGDRARFDALLAGSPLQAVRDGVDYPAVLLRAGVDGAQSREMAARLQQADPHGRAILFLTDGSSGNHPNLGDAVDRAADELGFLLDEVVAAQ
ncbi:prolyl oligopeptidase family serine peptidase [Scleromatobacter humisilvae]|uniref:Prolyl oligopeptidase family serine peptidase n=1 Tax=Scleromatobacter humisilvae TaxID=2897159 RepID=A0A9X2C186_9BURK|nr:prolyl oligopeptidase family serine peptidase [Scleromatobacter humisilvae]MCK9688563.1 prolyl oligopeptidase family serine peptidase [Scleromatobacter humisilvae]